MKRNEKQWSSATPGLLIILLDQSGSMLSDYEGGKSRTEFASVAVNRVVDNIIQKNSSGESVKNRCFISIIGYNHEVKEISSGWLSELAESPLRYDTVKRKISDGAGGIVEVEEKMPVWVEPITKDGTTNMYGAFSLAKDVIERWMGKQKDSPAPVIINISDGNPYYDGKNIDVCMQETTELAKEIMSMSNEDGNVLIFNAQIDTSNGTIVCPKSRENISHRSAKFLFDITSEIPESYRNAALKNELSTEDDARGCIFGADGVKLIQLIDFGSSKGLGDRQ